MNNLYAQAEIDERRVGSASLLALVRSTHEDVAAMRVSLSTHMHNETLALAEAIHTLTNTAFPEGDAAGHREYHLALMAAAKNKAEFWRKLSFELAKWGLLGCLGWLAADVARNHGFLK